MQRLRIETPGAGDDLWIEPDSDGEFVRADEAFDLINKYNTQALHLAGALRVLKIIRDTLPHINGSVRSVESLLDEIRTVMPEKQQR